MITTIVWRKTLRIVGIELPDAAAKPHLVSLAWASLSARRHLIKNPVHPHILYGVWRRKPEAVSPSYLVGIEVAEVRDLPEGLASCTVPASRFAVTRSEDAPCAAATAYEIVMGRDPASAAAGREAVALEVYDTSQDAAEDRDVPVYAPIQ
jgi:predicted transcriptional regulator YdeE